MYPATSSPRRFNCEQKRRRQQAWCQSERGQQLAAMFVKFQADANLSGGHSDQPLRAADVGGPNPAAHSATKSESSWTATSPAAQSSTTHLPYEVHALCVPQAWAVRHYELRGAPQRAPLLAVRVRLMLQCGAPQHAGGVPAAWEPWWRVGSLVVQVGRPLDTRPQASSEQGCALAG